MEKIKDLEKKVESKAKKVKKASSMKNTQKISISDYISKNNTRSRMRYSGVHN